MEGESWREEMCATEREVLEDSILVLLGVALLGGGFGSGE